MRSALLMLLLRLLQIGHADMPLQTQCTLEFPLACGISTGTAVRVSTRAAA